MEKQKLIYVESKALFSPSSVSNKAIVFIKDTKEIWTHGTYFICSNIWATPITLTLSGDSTGSVSIDGSGNVTLSVTNKYLHCTHGVITDANSALSPIYKMQIFSEFAPSFSNGFPATNYANAIININTHSQNYDHQLGFSSNKGIYHRTRAAGTWETSWREILTSTNYTNYPHTFASLTNKPTTISGYGITDSIPIIKGGEVTANTDLSTLGMTTSGAKLSVFHSNDSSIPDYMFRYSNALMFRSTIDTYAAISIDYALATVTFIGGRNAETTTDNVPRWWYRLLGASGLTYNLATIQTTINNLGSTYLPLTGGTLTDTLILKAGAFTASNSNSYSGGRYQAVSKPNIRLIGDSTYGLSTIEFTSQKGDTSINKPSDSGFIQFLPYGVSALSSVGSHPTLKTSGESNALVLGVTNDSDDIIVLLSPNISGLRHACGKTEYYLPHITTSTTTANKPLVSTTTAHVYTLGDEYLPLKGGTMTGKITLWSSNADAANTGGLNANNSNIYGLNSLYFADPSETAAEGINFYRSSTTVDSLWGSNGNLYWTPNRTYGLAGTSYYVLTSNNYSTHLNNTYLPLSGGTMTGNIILTTGKWIADSTTSTSILGTFASGNSTEGLYSEAGVLVGKTATQTTLSSNGDDLWHYRNSDKKRYKILDAANYTNYTINYAKSGITTSGYAGVINDGKLYYNSAISFARFAPDDNGGATSYELIAELPNYGTGTNTWIDYGISGFMWSHRGGHCGNSSAYPITAIVSIGPFTASRIRVPVTTEVLIPFIVKYDDKYYIALKKLGSSTTFYFMGIKLNLLTTPIIVNDASLIEEIAGPITETSTASKFYNNGNPQAYLHAGNYSNYALPLGGGTLTGTLTSSNITPRTSVTYNIGTTSAYYNNIYALYFKRKDSSDSYVLLGGGGHKLLSDLSSAHTHDWSSITSKPSLLGAMATPIFYPYAFDVKLGTYISTINNRFYSADLRYTVTTTNLRGDKHSLFDDNYDGRMEMDPGTTATITIEGYNFVYNNGYIMLYFYLYNAYPLKFPKSITAKATVLSGTEYTLNRVTAVESGNTIAFLIDLEFLTKLEFTIVSQDDAYCGITNIDYFTRRTENTTRDCAVVTKYNANTLYHNLTAPKYIVKNGTSSQFLKADGSLDNNAYLPLSGGTMTGNISWNADSHGIYFYGGCGIEKWSGYGPTLIAERNTDFYIRNSTDRADYHKIIHAGNYSSYALPISGGTMTGALNFANNTWNKVGDDAYMGDCNIGGMIGIKSANRVTPGFALFNDAGTQLGRLFVSGTNLYWSKGSETVNNIILHSGNYSEYALKIDGSNGTSDGVSALLNKLTTGTGNPQDADYYICQYSGGGTATTTYHRRPTSALYNYIRAKLYNSTSNYFIMGNGDLLSKEDVYSIGSYTAVKNSYYTGNAMYYYWYKIEFPESSSGSASATYSIMINDDNNYPRFSHYILNIKRYYANNIYGNSYQLTHLGGTSLNIMLWIANDSTPNLYILCPCAYGDYGLRIKCIYGTNKFNPTPVEYNNGGVASSFTIINKYLDLCSVRVNSTGVVTHTYGNIIKTDIVGNVTGTSSGNLTDISYDSTNRILKLTKNGTTTNVVTFGTNAFSSSKYAGSSSDGGAANKVANALTLLLNGGTTSGTNKFVYDGASAYTVNITPDSIGAAASSHTHDYLPLSGGTMSANGYIAFPASANSSALGNSTPMGITYGRIHSYGTLTIAGNTDASKTEFVNIVAGRNISQATAANGLSIGYNTLKWQGTDISLAGHNHDGSYLKLSGGTLGSSSASSTELRTLSSTAALRIMSYSDSTNYILSGNSSFDGNATLRITGYSNVTGTNLYFKFNNIYCRGNDYINIDSGNYGSYALPLSGGTMTGAINTANIYPTANAGFNIGSTSSYYNTMYAYYFKKYGSDDNYLLLGGGGHKKVSDFLLILDKGIEGGSGGNTDNWVLVLNNNYSTGWYGPCTMFYIRSKNFGCGILCFYHYWNTEGTSGYYDNSVWFFGAEHSAYSGTMGGTGRDINNYLKVYIDKENADLKIYYNRYNNLPLNVQELLFVHGPSGTLYPSGELRASHFINSTLVVELPTTSSTFVNIPIQTAKNHTEDIKTTRSVYASAFYENSDIRLKENVHSIDLIDLLKNVDLVLFNFKNDLNKKYGVIAQQLEQVGLNNLVYEHNGNKAVDYISLLVLETLRLRNEIKELKEKLDKKELSS